MYMKFMYAIVYFSLIKELFFSDKINLTIAKSIGAPKIQNVKWDDVGGLINVKEEIMSALKPSNLNMRRSGKIFILNANFAFKIYCSVNFIQKIY